MPEFIRPIVIVSKCLGFDACRWNGVTIPDDNVERLRSVVEMKPVCAEVEIGLGVPRPPIRVVQNGGATHLVQPETGRDCSEEMRTFGAAFLDTIGEVDGFILKSRSPSCGIKDVKIYPANGKSILSAKGVGFFTGTIIARYPHLPMEDEARLSNARLREHFYTRLFVQARFRHVLSRGTMRELVKFHSEQKLLLMAYNQAALRRMGRIVANPEKRKTAEVFSDYAAQLSAALEHPARVTSNINVLMHALGYFSEKLSSAEKAFFLETLEQYRAGAVPLSVCLALLQAWIARFKQPYLQQQSFMHPFPTSLVSMSDTSRGRLAE